MADDDEKDRDESQRDDERKDDSQEEDFDKDRALATIKKQRESEDAAKKEAKELRERLQKYEDEKKTDGEKLTEKVTAAEQRANAAAAETARLRIALRKGLNETQAKRLVGDSEEDLEKDADELLASFRTEDKDADEDKQDDPPRRPRERLRTGTTRSGEPEKDDPASLAKEVSRGW